MFRPRGCQHFALCTYPMSYSRDPDRALSPTRTNARAPVKPASAVGRRAFDIGMSIGYER